MSNLGNTEDQEEDTERLKDFWVQPVKKFDRLRFKKNELVEFSNRFVSFIYPSSFLQCV